MLTVITPTTGKESLFNAILSLKNQKSAIPIRHIILWDNKREGEFLFPDESGKIKLINDLEVESGAYSSNCIVVKDNFIQGQAVGSALRAIGLMIANTEWVTFMDDDIMWDSCHIESIMNAVENSEWGFCKRRIWTNNNGEYECLGIDEYESVGEEAKTAYKMVDNNCLVFKKKYGISAACLYRNTTSYDDDRLMYNFLNMYAGVPAKSNETTVNQICPERLINFFSKYCTKEELNGN